LIEISASAHVVLAVQQGADLEVVDVLAQRGELARRFVPGVLVVLVVGKLEQDTGVRKPLPQVFQPAKLPSR